MAHLFSPLTIKDITMRNRIGVSPMCQYQAKDGLVNHWHLVHLGSRAVGGAGLIIAEASGVSAEGRITPGDAGIWNGAQAEAWRPVTDFMKLHGAVPGIQIAHAGRKAGDHRPWEGSRQLTDEQGGWEAIAPTAEPFGGRQWRTPREMTIADIQRVQAEFAAAAKHALAAGFEFLEIHCAHGYLHNTFLSPLGNQRTDQYGGSFENRTRFLLETVRQVRAAWPERLPLAVRLSATDWMEGGWELDDSIELSKILKSEGIDLVDCSSGGVARGPRTADPGPSWQVPLASGVRHGADILTAAVGDVTHAAQADAIVRQGQADIVLLGREYMRRPYWPYHAAKELGHSNKGLIPDNMAHWIGDKE